MGLGDDMKNTKDKLMGGAKEKMGDATDNEQMQAEGTGQQAKGQFGDKVEDVKDAVAEKFNNAHDRK